MKQKAEEKLKLINEAYEVLSNPDSRAKYDETLKQSEISEEDFNRLSEENRTLYNEINNLKHTNNNNNNYYNNNPTEEDIRREQEYQRKYEEQLEYENQIQQVKQKAYHDAYIQDLKNRGYKIRYKKTPKDYLKNFLAFILTIAILFIIWQIPFVHNFFIKVFSENPIIQTIINLFK